MATMNVTEDTSERIILKLREPESDSRISVLKAYAIVFGIAAVAAYFAFNNPRSWFSWVIFALALFIAYKVSQGTKFPAPPRAESTISINLHEQQIVIFDTFKSGKVKKCSLKFNQVTRVIVQTYEHQLAGGFLDATVLLDVQNAPSLLVNFDKSHDPTAMKQLGLHIGKMIGKPVILNRTGEGDSEEVIQE